MFSICCNSCVKLWKYKKDTQRITKIKPFVHKFNWEGINFPLEKDGWNNLRKIM